MRTSTSSLFYLNRMCCRFPVRLTVPRSVYLQPRVEQHLNSTSFCMTCIIVYGPPYGPYGLSVDLQRPGRSISFCYNAPVALLALTH